MSRFVGENPILEMTDKVLRPYPYQKKTHPTFGIPWYERGGEFTVPDNDSKFMLKESANRHGIRRRRYLPFLLIAGTAEDETGGWVTEEYSYSPDTNALTIAHSMAPNGETWEEFKQRQTQLRIETFFDDDSKATLAERERFLNLIQLIGEKGILLEKE